MSDPTDGRSRPVLVGTARALAIAVAALAGLIYLLGFSGEVSSLATSQSGLLLVGGGLLAGLSTLPRAPRLLLVAVAIIVLGALDLLLLVSTELVRLTGTAVVVMVVALLEMLVAVTALLFDQGVLRSGGRFGSRPWVTPGRGYADSGSSPVAGFGPGPVAGFGPGPVAGSGGGPGEVPPGWPPPGWPPPAWPPPGWVPMWGPPGWTPPPGAPPSWPPQPAAPPSWAPPGYSGYPPGGAAYPGEDVRAEAAEGAPPSGGADRPGDPPRYDDRSGHPEQTS